MFYSDAEIWYGDGDLCEECNGLLDDFGIRIECGWDGIDYDDEFEYGDDWQ